jgi:hypothetical protein
VSVFRENIGKHPRTTTRTSKRGEQQIVLVLALVLVLENRLTPETYT